MTMGDLAEKLSYEKIQNLIEYRKSWGWLFYVFIPFKLLVTTSFTTSLMAIGVFVNSDKFQFKSLFKVALIAQFVFLLPDVIKILWFSFVHTDYLLKDINEFYPLSLYSCFGLTAVESWLKYPLQNLNVFEFIYCIILYKNIEEIMPSNGISAVASYLLGLLTWTILVMFLTLTYST